MGVGCDACIFILVTMALGLMRVFSPLGLKIECEVEVLPKVEAFYAAVRTV